MLQVSGIKNRIAFIMCCIFTCTLLWGNYAFAANTQDLEADNDIKINAGEKGTARAGGGYAITKQSSSIGYSSKVYDDTNGLLTADANFVLGSSDGYVWIGSYSGIFRYDGTEFEKIEYSEGLTSGRALFEDRRGRIWVGTNDNGVVVIEGTDAKWITYKEGLPSSSIRDFSEDNEGNVYIGTTSGVCYADKNLKIHIIDDARINGERVLRLSANPGGTVIYGATKNGIAFKIENKEITNLYGSLELDTDRITSILADPWHEGEVYITTDGKKIYHGTFGDSAKDMNRISVYPIKVVHWINYDCDRIWISSTNKIGYLDENNRFHMVNNLPVNSGIEMVTSDFQGNIWVASSTEGIMKIVAANFDDMTKSTALPNEVINTTCLVGESLYVGTDNGLRILYENELVENKIVRYLEDTRIRHIMTDTDDNLWFSTYTGGFGLVRYDTNYGFRKYTVQDGLPSNEIRCTKETQDGSILVCTNGGLAILKDGEVQRVVDSSSGIKNTVFLTAEEGENGEIYVGTDGDGIYVIDGNEIKKIGRDDGLTSDVILRIKKDDTEELYWVVASNSIGYIKNGAITTVKSFPYTNNYDLFFDKKGNVWILSSYGIYVVSKEELLSDNVNDYRNFTSANGLTSTPTSNCYCELTDDGTLYIAGRHGVCKVNIYSFFEGEMDVKLELKSVYFGDQRILPDREGRYVLPSEDARLKINAAVLDYTLADPMVHIYIEGDEKDEILVPKSKTTALEYTGMNHGTYILHIQVLASKNTEAMLDRTYQIVKQPKLFELLIVRVFMFILITFITGFIVWRITKGTVIKRQIDEIKQARDDAERANSAKTRFLANISHEIRTPINTILGMNEMIMREDATGVPKGYFLSMMNYAFDIKNATEALLGLINDLLDISKIESGKMHLVEQEYDVQELLRSIVSMIRVKSTEKELTFDVVVDEILPSRLYGDAGKIKQVLLNLLTNAVKYTDKGGFILMVTLKERENDVIRIDFNVKDTGMGVKEEDIEKLFTAYERLDEQKNSAIQGTGLGLDISRRFALLMGGSLSCISTYGEGSEFILSIEQKIVDDTPIGLFVEHDEKKASGPYIPKFIAPDADVLVVDDNPMNLNVIKGLLKATKIFVTTAGSGEECLEKMRTTRFNVVLLDHMMPGMDGIETVAKIRETDKDIPVYALTANISVGEDFYKSKGFTGYLSKPIDTEVLEKTIMKHLPEEIMFKPEPEEAPAEPDKIPEDLMWIYDTEGITVEEGIKNSGGISSYIFSLKLFLETIDGNAKVISDAYEAEDIRLYTIKVHALKSSARIIGAMPLFELCQSLEDAGNKQDKEFIVMHTDELLKDYLEFKEKLSRLNGDKDASDKDKQPIAPEDLKDAYGALKDVIPQMDYDSVEMILNNLNEYSLPKEDSEKISKLSQMLKVFDWEGMEELINS